MADNGISQNALAVSRLQARSGLNDCSAGFPGPSTPWLALLLALPPAMQLLLPNHMPVVCLAIQPQLLARTARACCAQGKTPACLCRAP